MPEEQLIQDPDDIRLNSNDEIQQILGHPPGWLLRWGITLIFLSVMVFMALAWIIKYPDIVTAQATITTENPPLKIVALNRGKIKELRVEDNQDVTENTLLAILDDPADHKDIQKLYDVLPKEEINNIHGLAALNLPQDLKIGILQDPYAALVQKLKDFKHYYSTNITTRKIKALEEQIKQNDVLNKSLIKQLGYMKKELVILEKDLNRQNTLFKGGNVREIDVEAAETKYLQFKRQVESVNSNMTNNDKSSEQLKVQIMDLSQNKTDLYSQKKLAINKDISTIKTAIKNWQQNFLITSPIAGKVSMAKDLSLSQFVNVNEEVMTIVPEEDAGEILCKALVLEGVGKVNEGMDVNLQLNGFPYQEFGVVKGKVRSISLVPNEENYIAEIQLINGLNTTYNKAIDFRQEMKGSAQIVTEERTIFDRIFDKILDVIYNR